MTRLVITAYGTPRAQGSKKHVGHGRMVESSKRLAPWRQTILDAATDAGRYHDTYTTPVRVWARFTCARPKSDYRSGRNAHLLRDTAPLFPTNRQHGDVEKLVRACFDPLTTAGIWTDDSLVVDLRARKVFAGESEYALDRPGVQLVIEPIDLPSPTHPTGDTPA